MYDKNPRSEAKKITLEAEKPKFIGFKGSAVYQQEFFSLVNIKSALGIIIGHKNLKFYVKK